MSHEKRVEFLVPGLGQRVRIRIDRWGIPHIRAENTADLFFAQGFNAARDRLWQIDLWRKRGLGLLAADFGPGYLAQDKAARLFLYRGEMDAEWRSYAVDARSICEAFVAGINAYVEAIEQEKAPLPAEFSLMGTGPARWRAEDVVRIRSHGLIGNAQSEIARAVLLSAGQEAADRLRQRRCPDAEADNPSGIDLGLFPTEIIDLLKLASAPVGFSRERLEAQLTEAARWRKVDEFGAVCALASSGSNSWAVHGTRTATGRPILASDPHRALTMPSIRYLVHLSAPDIDVIGAGEPCVPGVSIGHNERIAFGLTIFDADQEDVYLYETKADDPSFYRHDDDWEHMTRIVERFDVKGAPTQEETFFFTRHGPVVFANRSKNMAVAVRSVWGEPGSAPYLASLSTMRARDFREFHSALERWRAPAVNKTYADVDGHIAWTPAGFVPRRESWSGMLPVSGSGGFEWNGNLSRAEMPKILDPIRGFVATANEFNLPADWDHSHKPVGFEWSESSRSVRICTVLSGAAAHDLHLSQRLQTDVTSIPAERLQRLLGPLALRDKDAGEARDLLMNWTARIEADSAPAALFELWWLKHLRPAVVAAESPALGDLAHLVGIGDSDAILALLEENASRYQSLLENTLNAAAREARNLLGVDQPRWRWGDLHQALFAHPLSQLAAAGTGFDVGPFAIGGDASTPMHASAPPSSRRVLHGASVRLIMAIGDWDLSLCINTPGQSGDPTSEFYANLAPIWAAGAYVPLLFSSTQIEAATEKIIDMVPLS